MVLVWTLVEGATERARQLKLRAPVGVWVCARVARTECGRRVVRDELKHGFRHSSRVRHHFFYFARPNRVWGVTA